MTDMPTSEGHYQALGQRLNELATSSIPGHIVRRLAVATYPGPVEYVDCRIESATSRTRTGEIVAFTPRRVVVARFSDAPTFAGFDDPGITATVDVACISRAGVVAVELPANASEWQNVDRAWGDLSDGAYVTGIRAVVKLGDDTLTLPLDPSVRDADARLFAFLPSLLSDLDRDR